MIGSNGMDISVPQELKKKGVQGTHGQVKFFHQEQVYMHARPEKNFRQAISCHMQDVRDTRNIASSRLHGSESPRRSHLVNFAEVQETNGLSRRTAHYVWLCGESLGSTGLFLGAGAAAVWMLEALRRRACMVDAAAEDAERLGVDERLETEDGARYWRKW